MNEERNSLIKRQRFLASSKKTINPAFKVIDTASGEASSFYSPEFAHEESRKKALQGQSDLARRRIILKK